jgi:hypothetical protein
MAYISESAYAIWDINGNGPSRLKILSPQLMCREHRAVVGPVPELRVLIQLQSATELNAISNVLGW